MKEDKLLKDVKEILKGEGVEEKVMTRDEVYKEFLLPGLNNSKNILEPLYSFKVNSKSGIIGKLKMAVQSKIVNTCINVLERQSIKQQKFNELTFRSIEKLIEENRELRKKIDELSK